MADFNALEALINAHIKSYGNTSCKILHIMASKQLGRKVNRSTIIFNIEIRAFT